MSKNPSTALKTSTLGRRSVSLLSAGVTLALAALVGASTSTQVKQLDPLVVPRTAHVATALADGRILITGGRDSSGNIVAVSEIFDPATATSTASATLTTPRVDHTATLLQDGRVLVAGGTGASGALNSAEIFDGAGFQVLPASMGAARAGHTATRLSDGTVLIAGGDAAGTAEIFDPTTESFSSALLNMAAPRTGHTATLFSNDNVLFAGGNTDSMELFSAVGQTFTLDSQVMSAARTGHTAIALSDTRLLFFEGDTGNTIDEFNHSIDTLTLKDTLGVAASSATLLANGKILVLRPDAAGLYDPNATDSSTAFTAFDETSVPDSSMLLRSGQTATQLSGDKRILVAGGVNAQNLSVNPALFNAARIWTDKDDYQPGDNVVLSGSGWKPNENVYLYAVDNQTQAWTYGSTVAADASGGFVVNPYFVVQLVQDGANFRVTAVGAQSAMQAEVKFTDSTLNSVTPGAQVGTATSGTAASPTFDVAVAFVGSGNPTNQVTLTFAWNGTPPAGIVSTPFGTNPVPGGSAGTQHSTLTINTGATTLAGSYSFTVTGTPSSGPAKSGTGTLTVNGQSTSLSVSTASGTYGGTSTSLSATLTASGNPVSGVSVSFTLNGNSAGSANTNASGVATVSGVSLCGASYNAGSYPSGVAASFAGDGTYAAANGTNSLTVGKANAAVVVTPYTVTYDGNSHTATVTSITGVCGQTGATVGSVNVSGTTHTSANNNVPYNDTWTFTPTANYNNITTGNTITDTINKATPTFSNLTLSQTITQGTASITLNGRLNAGSGVVPSGTGTITVDGAPVASTGTFGGVNGNFNAMVNTTAIPAGTYDIVYNYATDANFNAATDSTPHTTLTVTGGTTMTSVASSANPSIYGDSVTFTATVTSSSTPTGGVNFVIDGGSPVAGTAGGTTSTTATWTYTTSALNAGTHTVAASFVHTGIFQDSSGSLSGGQVVNKANATIVVTPYTVTYDTFSHTATVTSITGVGGETGATVGTVDVSGTTHTNAGTYNDSWSFTPTANYNPYSGSTAITDTINKADATIVVTPYTVTYDTFSHTATVTSITGVGGETGATVGTVDVSGTTHTNAGTYNDSWSFTPTANYNPYSGSTAITDTINKADATIVVTPYTVTYDTFSHTATVTSITGVGGETGATVGTVDVSGTTHTLPGDYTADPWTFTGTANYNNTSGTVHDIIHYGDCLGSSQGGVILPPINSDGTSVYSRKGGSTIPVKFTVCDANGNPISNPAAVFGPNGVASITPLSAVRGTVDNVNELPAITVADTGFRFTGDQWIFNMATTNLTAGTTYTFRINLAYGPGIIFKVGVK